MCDEFITSKHIEKLSHHIPEIRERALLNIHSKLQRGILYDNDLARSKELFWQLCNWFRDISAGEARHDEVVLKMLKRILKSESGIFLIDLHGTKELVKEFNELKQIVDESAHCHLLEIVKYLEDVGSMSRHPNVPPLDLNELNSCQSCDETDQVGTTATTIAGFVDSFVSLEVENDNNLQKASGKSSKEQKHVEIGGNDDKFESPFRHYTFLWQWLIGADRHVLESVENTLRNPSEPSELLNSFEFISDVLLHDFPAEVFLQRPAIIKLLHDLLWSSPSSRITTAILKCLGKLTKEFINRIHYYENPGIHNLKLNNFHIDSPNLTSRDEDCDDSSSFEVETIKETSNLMKSQMNLPQFCLNTINAVFDYLYVSPEAGDTFRRKKCEVGINTSLVLLKDVIVLLKLSTKPAIFNYLASKSTIIEHVQIILKKFNETLHKYGEVLSYFRIKVLSDDFPVETRLIQLHLLHNLDNLFMDFINLSRNFIPANLQHALTETLLDAALSRLFPNLHRNIHNLVQNIAHNSQAPTTSSYSDVQKVCTSMTSTIKFLREHKSLPFTKNISLVEDALISLEFHENLTLISTFINILANKLTTHAFDEEIFEKVENILLKLLSHHEHNLKFETYKNCHLKVLKTIGAKHNSSKSSSPGSQILFLLRPKVLSLIAMQGMNDTDVNVQGISEDIMIHVLKAKLLVSDAIWRIIVEALVPTLPILLTHVGRNGKKDEKSLIGRHIVAILDPDRARMMNFANVEILRLNIGLLFTESAEVRMEGASRLCWLLSSCRGDDDGSGDEERWKSEVMLPHLNNLHDKVLADVCKVERRVDFKNCRGATHFYQPSSLHQVLDLLAQENVEPVIRRSAITQISVMMEDPLLHSLFLERNGLRLMKRLMRSALIESDYRDYPDSVIPCLAILKNLCLYSATLRLEVAISEELMHFILRGIFLFCAEARVKQDGAILLFLIVFNQYLRGSPLKGGFSLAETFRKNLMGPFETKSFSGDAKYALESLNELKTNKWSMSSLQIHWNIEYFQGIEKLFQPQLVYPSKNDQQLDSLHFLFSDELKLSQTDLKAVKSSSLCFVIEKCLEMIYQSHSHEIIMENLQILMRCINLFAISKTDSTSSQMDIESFPWEKTFTRYLNAPPAGVNDNLLLSSILDFLATLFPHLKHSQNESQSHSQQSSTKLSTWINTIVTSKTHFFNDLLSIELTQEQDQPPDLEKLINSLLTLINACVLHENEQALFKIDANATKISKSQGYATFKYAHVVKILVSNLKSTHTKHFYNLAYLDRILKSLTHLTATIGWSGCDGKMAARGQSQNGVVTTLLSCAFELLNAFHCGKGVTAADSLMGLSITRNVVFVLNHLIDEMLHFGVMDLMEEVLEGEESIYRCVFALTNSRDVVLRATAFHLLSGMGMSTVCSRRMIEDISREKDHLHLWKMALKTLCDHEESSIVRENAALLLTNLSSHHEQQQDGGEMYLSRGLLTKEISSMQPPTKEFLQNSQKRILTTFLEGCNFFNEMEIILKRLQTRKTFNFYELRLKASDSNSDLDDFMFVYNKVLEVSHISDSLNPHIETKSAQKYEETFGLTTPGLIKALATFVYNLVCVLPQTMSKKLHTLGIVKLFFRCVSLPTQDIDSTRDLMFYTDLLEMNSAIYTLLTKTAECNTSCLLTIGNSRDCLCLTTSLLDADIYVITLQELHYLRNKLWTNIYNLLGVLLRNSGKNDGNCADIDANEAKPCHFDVNTLITQLEHRKEQFFLSLCESLTTSVEVSCDLQTSALNSFSSLLRCNNSGYPQENKILDSPECAKSQETQKSSNIQLILDTTRTPRSTTTNESEQTGQISSKKVDILQEIYFGTSRTRKSSLSISNSSLNSLKSDASHQLQENVNFPRMAGAELCKILLELYETLDLQSKGLSRKKTTILNTLTGLLLVSNEAKNYALSHGFVSKIISQFQAIYVQLSLENIDNYRKPTERKRISSILQHLEALIGLCMNFLHGNRDVKRQAAELGLSEVIFKLWSWFGVQKNLLIIALKLLCTLTTNCTEAAASLARKSSNSSIIHIICAMITKEMECISRTHCLDALKLCFHVLHNAVAISECRFALVKLNFVNGVCKLHPHVTKRQRPWEVVELLWLEWLGVFAEHGEGQLAIGKAPEVFEMVLMLCGSCNGRSRLEALKVVRNVAFFQGNRARLLASDEFLNILSTRLSASNPAEVTIVIPAIWALAANCQKAKMVFKAARIDCKIKDYLRYVYLNNYEGVSEKEVETLQYVLGLLTQNV